ncbi:MAG: alpha/beta fold hydrolase [Cyanobacteriota bacterium]|nr:alpha/beta fold hydrolase [Cyanobacteriota bacterium]
MAAALLRSLGMEPFQERFPWMGADLQTLHDSLLDRGSHPETGQLIELPAGRPAGLGRSRPEDRLAGFLEPSLAADRKPAALVVVVHGLAGSSAHCAPRRLGLALQKAGLMVLRLNLRGAGAGRSLAPGSYAADSSADLLPALARAREFAEGRPLFGVGLSLGGTQLLRAVQASPDRLDGLVCISSPLDLQTCTVRIEEPRNTLYQGWLLRRLKAQVLADPFGLPPRERDILENAGLRSIRSFDAAITAPRWGYRSVDEYYNQASPLPALLDPRQRARLPRMLLVQALDDPWVPAGPAVSLARLPDPGRLEVLLTSRGGHGGFQSHGDSMAIGCWSDRLTACWLRRLLDS